MLEWHSPWAFGLLLLLPPLLGWLHRRRPRLRFASLQLVALGPSLRLRLASLSLPLLGAGLALCVVALARPQLALTETISRSEGIDIALVLDTSQSMDSPDFAIGGRRASRLDVAKAVVARFVAARPDDRIALVVFGEEAFTQVPLTLDHAALARFLGQVQIGQAGHRRTAVGDGLAVAARRLAKLEAPSKVAILLTDGRNNAGSVEPERAAEAAAALGVKVYTIGIGPEEGQGGGWFGLAAPRGGELDEPALRSIAAITGGQYFRAQDAEALAQVYQAIDQLEPTTAEVEELTHYEERFGPWLGWGLALLALRILLDATLLRRLP